MSWPRPQANKNMLNKDTFLMTYCNLEVGTILYLPLNDYMQLMPNYYGLMCYWQIYICFTISFAMTHVVHHETWVHVVNCNVVVSHWRHLWILFLGVPLDELITRIVFQAVAVLWLYLQVSYAATEQVRWPTAHLAWITGTQLPALPMGTNRKRSVKPFCRYFTPGKVLDAGLIKHDEQSTA